MVSGWWLMKSSGRVSRDTRRLLAFLVLQYAAVSACLVLVLHEPWKQTGLLPPAWFLTWRQGADSWASMDQGHDYIVSSTRQGTLYEATFFSPGLEYKGFQYPPSALLLSEAAERLGERRWIEQAITWLWIPATAFLLALLDRRLAPAAGRADRIARDLACAFATLTFFPVIRAYADGQLQTWINGLFTAALLAFTAGRPAVSGAAVAAAFLLKPQAGFVALWGAVRGRWRFVVGFGAVSMLGAAVSVTRYGVAPHAEYLDVLRFLAHHGESFFPNQSVNGLLQRWLGNGYNLTFYAPGSISWIDHFPPYHAVVYVVTVATSCLLLVAALVPPRREERGGALDLAFACVAATVASPIAWDHHYGVLLPVFLLMLHAARERALGGGFVAALAALYVVAGNCWWVTRRLAETPWNPLQSYLLFAALGLMALLALARTQRIEICRPIVAVTNRR